MHQKLIKLSLTILNTLLVMTLLVFSALLFYSVEEKNPSLFGYSLFLVKDDATNTAVLAFVDKNSTPTINEEFLYISTDGQGSRICTATESAGDMLTFIFSDNQGTDHTVSLSLTGDEYGGVVRMHSGFLGGLFEPFSNRNNMPFIYMLIGGICALILLLLVLLYFFFQSKEEEKEEAALPNDDEAEAPTAQTAPEVAADPAPHPYAPHIAAMEVMEPPLTPPPIGLYPELMPAREPILSPPAHKVAEHTMPTRRPEHSYKPAPADSYKSTTKWGNPFTPPPLGLPPMNDDADMDDAPSIESLMEELKFLSSELDDK